MQKILLSFLLLASIVSQVDAMEGQKKAGGDDWGTIAVFHCASVMPGKDAVVAISHKVSNFVVFDTIVQKNVETGEFDVEAFAYNMQPAFINKQEEPNPLRTYVSQNPALVAILKSQIAELQMQQKDITKKFFTTPILQMEYQVVHILASLQNQNATIQHE